MTKLEHLQPNASVNGILPHGLMANQVASKQCKVQGAQFGGKPCGDCFDVRARLTQAIVQVVYRIRPFFIGAST